MIVGSVKRFKLRSVDVSESYSDWNVGVVRGEV
jgi:hypothetical protein